MIVTKKLMILSVSLLILAGCTPKHSEIVVAKYADSEIKMPEFEAAYAKNSGGIEKAKTDSLPQLKNFLNLYVNFNMKLQDAKSRGFDKDPAMQAELLDYKKKVGVTYILEKLLVDPQVQNLYEMRKYEYKVSHIMIRPDASGDSLAAAKANEVITKLKNGQPFESMVEQYSDDAYSKKSGGDIYFITAGTVIPEFEDAVYKTKVGETYPEAVKTKYGYHIIKVTEKRERIPQVKAAHIMVDFMDADGNADSAGARAKIDSIYTMLQEGSDFATLAKMYSEDQGSAQYGGELGFFERRMMVKEFDEVAFDLKPGELSGVVNTSYGYHIIKILERKPYPTLDEDRENLKRIYKNSRYQHDNDTLVAGLKQKYGYKLHADVVSSLITMGDSVRINDEYRGAPWREDIKDKAIMSFGSQNVTVDEFMEILIPLPEFGNRMINEALINDGIKKVSGDKALETEALNLEKTVPEFADLMADYKNGIYIFKLQEEEVWNKVELDSTRLYAFWEKQKDKYRWENRVEFAEIFSKTDSTIQKYYAMLQKGENFDTLASKFTERPGFKEKAGKFQMLSVNSSQQSTEAWKLNQPGDFSAPIPVTGGFSIIKLIKKDPAREKTFEEARAEVSGAFQEDESKRLENSYIESLKNSYKPEYFYDRLTSAFRDPQK